MRNVGSPERCQVEFFNLTGQLLACGAPCEKVWSIGDEYLGARCSNGHIWAPKRDRKKRCSGCGSSHKKRHATGCAKVIQIVDLALALAQSYVGSISHSRSIDELIRAQELIDEVLELGTSRTGGPL